MDNQNNGYGQSAPHFEGGRLSASRSSQGKPAPRPSMDDLAPYSAINYTSRGSKNNHVHTKKRRITLISLVAAIVLLLFVPGIMLANSAKSAMNDAQVLMNQGAALMSQIQSGDVESARRTARNLNSIAKDLENNLNAPLWVPLTFIPVYGSDVSAMRSLAGVASELSEYLLVPLTDELPVDGNARLFVDGGFNIFVIQAILGSIGNASPVIQECSQRVNAINDPHLVQLTTPVKAAKQFMASLNEISGYAGDLSRVLPEIMGANGPRTYLIIACTEAELRTVGGYPGSAGLMTMDNGKMEVGHMDAPSIPIISPDAIDLKLTDEEWTLFGSRAGECFYDAGYIPDFPRAAEFMKAIWDADGRPSIDGILSVDPVFLQSVLELTGAVTTSDGVVVDGSNAAEVLSNAVYTMYRTEMFEAEASESAPEGAEADIPALAMRLAALRQNAFFSEVASLALDSFFTNISSVNMLDAVQVLGTSIANKRIYMWLSNPDEQAVIEKLDAACALSESEANPELGVYLATTIATKVNWYLDVETSVADESVNSDGSMTYRVTTTITNTLSPEEAQALPSYVVNPDQYANDRIRSAGDMILDVYLLAPMGGSIADVLAEGSFASETLFDDMFTWYTKPGTEPMTELSYNGRCIWYGVTMIEPGQKTVLNYTVTTSSNATSNLVVDTTPLAHG